MDTPTAYAGKHTPNSKEAEVGGVVEEEEVEEEEVEETVEIVETSLLRQCSKLTEGQQSPQGQ